MKLSDLEEGRLVPGDCGRPENSRPDWLDMDMVCRAREVYKENVYSIMLGHSCGPVLLGHVATLVIPIKFTGNAATVPHACRRLANTVHHVLAWYEGDIWNKDDYGYQSLQYIRRLHGNVVRKMTAAGEAPLEGNVWLSQYDMALTLFAFMGPIVVDPKKVGMQCTERDMECLLHFWRCAGYLLGMEDRFNICAGNYQETKAIFQEIVDHVAFPTLSNPQAEFQKLIYNGVESLKSHSPFIEYNSFVNFSYGLIDFPERKPWSCYGLVCHWIRLSYIFFILPITWLRNYTNKWGSALMHVSSEKLRKPSAFVNKNAKRLQRQPSRLWSFIRNLILDTKLAYET